MRRGTILRESRLIQAAVGASILAGPASAALADPAHNATAQSTPPQTGSAVKTRVKAQRLRYGQAVVVTGRAPSSEDGQPVTLQFEPSGSTSWQQIAAGHVGAGGGFRLSAPLRHSGAVRVSIAASPTLSDLATGAAAGTDSTAPRRVAVAAAIRIRRRSLGVFGGRTVSLRGQLLPHSGHRRVLLQAWRGGRWITQSSASTRTSGRFELRYRAVVPGRVAVRIRFRGDRRNTAVTAPAGRLTVFRQSTASWYEDGGATACGFHAHYGVANLSLPCGARVTFSHAGRTVTAVVDDRGPYVGGREWDLNQSTAAALGFAGVGSVWSSS